MVVVCASPQTPEYDPQKSERCVWKADEAGACVLFVMAKVDWVVAEVEVVVGRLAGQMHMGLVACLEMPEHFPKSW